ncbi:hypothetical protein EX30DRAFT_267021 [Ascodesmis nigricans]|uniref:Uncharacterized protein n=1 Tax=Ascodesmis nigricans TaxID=341454 RepID=A0A4S2MPE3_9PEZI|nr:hypothetical protein EX30DRAFT_267021 [Ascodesmis nigricans]
MRLSSQDRSESLIVGGVSSQRTRLVSSDSCRPRGFAAIHSGDDKVRHGPKCYYLLSALRCSTARGDSPYAGSRTPPQTPYIRISPYPTHPYLHPPQHNHANHSNPQIPVPPICSSTIPASTATTNIPALCPGNTHLASSLHASSTPLHPLHPLLHHHPPQPQPQPSPLPATPNHTPTSKMFLAFFLHHPGFTLLLIVLYLYYRKHGTLPSPFDRLLIPLNLLEISVPSTMTISTFTSSSSPPTMTPMTRPPPTPTIETFEAPSPRTPTPGSVKKHVRGRHGIVYEQDQGRGYVVVNRRARNTPGRRGWPPFELYTAVHIGLSYIRRFLLPLLFYTLISSSAPPFSLSQPHSSCTRSSSTRSSSSVFGLPTSVSCE